MFQNSQIVKALKFTDLKKICVQQYKQEKIELNSDEMITTIRLWDPSTWILSSSRQIVIPKKISCTELNILLLKDFPGIKVKIRLDIGRQAFCVQDCQL